MVSPGEAAATAAEIVVWLQLLAQTVTVAAYACDDKAREANAKLDITPIVNKILLGILCVCFLATDNNLKRIYNSRHTQLVCTFSIRFMMHCQKDSFVTCNICPVVDFRASPVVSFRVAAQSIRFWRIIAKVYYWAGPTPSIANYLMVRLGLMQKHNLLQKSVSRAGSYKWSQIISKAHYRVW